MITAHINHCKRRSQHGQAMVEYAILLVVAFLFMFGAAELTSAGFNSYKTSEGAKAGAVEYVGLLNVFGGSLSKLNQKIEDIDRSGGSLDQLEDDTPQDLDGNGTNDELERYLTVLEAELGPLTVEIIDDLLNGLHEDLLPLLPSNIYNLKVELLKTKKAALLLAANPIELADHDPATSNLISSPQCVGDDYDDGLGNRFVDPNRYLERYIEGESTLIYLFNPLPIDIESCMGVDDARDGLSRISILVGGYYDRDNPDLNVPGLPKLNQAMYSQYVKVCLEGNDYALDQACSNGMLLLKPPGKLCLSDDADSEGCPDSYNDADRPITGYYFFGGDTTPELAATFRPTFQIECNNEGFTSDLVMTESCLVGPLFSLRIHTRYRYVFDSFVPFGAAEMNDESLIPYYYNPGRMGKSGSNNLVGAAGSELGPVGDTGLPTIKPFRDFRGCHEVDLSTNQISACN
ncbi:pilus assembly protein [Pseudomethylobacillus aquaticus]|uniref:Pilus assembly protein n=1 Tax=Pseudomethylobacillus aquaticus TaxID=2676064 RepID=A0A3N0UYH4_9PROT|nr:TadE family protein [Pseudomethylobacillus aquaticus]ROH85324.1 pilus assembly protein [Pseudomethylobacillus aquaticus]